MAATLKLTHRLFSIEGVPDNLSIAQGEKFTLEVTNDGLAATDPPFRWLIENDWVLEEERPAEPVGLNRTRTFTALSVGTSTIQLQYFAPGANIPTIDRAYVVSVIARADEAVSLNATAGSPQDK